MRRRWEVNGDAALWVGVGWTVAWFVILLATGTDDGPRIWAIVAWLGPYAVALVVTLAWQARLWLRSDDGWLIRRTREPVTEDLREVEDATAARRPRLPG